MTCVEPIEGDLPAKALRVEGSAHTTVIDPPWWCSQNELVAHRTDACEVRGLVDRVYRKRGNGPWVQTGELKLSVFSYAYMSTVSPFWAHMIYVSAYDGWGDTITLGTSVEGVASKSGACSRQLSNFPLQPVTPLFTRAVGESSFKSTATASGAVGTCTTAWTLRMSTPTYNSSDTISYPMTPIRCDNATAGTTTPGCVVPWYASAVYYSLSSYPTLAMHVIGAQASGLPGDSFDDPLTRTTNQFVIDLNRQLACGDAPSIPGWSCDEYPPATSYQGLSLGGERRTQGGCQFPNLPRQTGATGVSVCMIVDTENSAQGGLHAQFFRDHRILDSDRFRVLISN